MIKSYQQKTKEVVRSWHLVDIKGLTLGRAATEIAKHLIGKDKPTYTPHIDGGDFVVVINSDLLNLTGKKLDGKLYQHHTGHPGGFRKRTAKEQMERDSTRVVEHSVKGMLPKNKLQTPRLRRLKVYSGAEHPHTNHFNKENK